MKTHHCTAGLLLICLIAVRCLGAEESRNPFGVADIVDPINAASEALAGQMKLTGDDKDPNATDWTDKPLKGNPMFLDGDWFGRWNGGGGGNWSSCEATIQVVDDRVFILYKQPDSNSGYLIEARRIGDTKLVGSYVSLGSSGPPLPWAGLIVSGERIDGIWSSEGARWDFRRRAIRKLPKTDRSK